MLNEDSSTIEFQSFDGKDENIYPTLSLCFRGKGIFDKAKIRKQTNYEKSYRAFLEGKVWDEKLLEIGYDNVTLDARKMVQYISMSSVASEGKPIYEYIRKGSRRSFPFRISFQSARAKCYSLDLNEDTIPNLGDDQLSKVAVIIENYFGGVKHFMKQNNEQLNLDLFLTYPNQLIRSFPVMKIKHIHEREGAKFANVIVYGLEMVQKRSKANDICTSNWLENDNEILKELISKVGCKHESWKLGHDLAMNQSRKRMELLSLNW